MSAFGMSARLAQNRDAGFDGHTAMNTPCRSRLAPISGHPQSKPASRPPLQ